MAWRRTQVIAAVVLVGAGCGSGPASPRPVRTLDGAKPPSAVGAPVDEDAPSRGLPCDEQAGRLRLCGAATDNYKASYNEDPSAPERRTWLAVHRLELDGRRYRVGSGTGEVRATVVAEAVDAGADGARRITLEARVVDGPASTPGIRVGPQQGLWGPLLQVSPRDGWGRGAEVVVELAASDGDGEPATARVRYVWDATLAAAAPRSLEHGGPGGRWHVGGSATATNLELGWE